MGDSDDGASGPFHKAYNTFCKGGVISLVVGSHGETNQDFEDFLKVCAHMAVARGDAVYNSPIFETEVKGGAHSSFTLHHYHPTIAGPIARGLSPHKRSRLHFVRGSREETARVSEDARSHETCRCSVSDGFLARHSIQEHSCNELRKWT